MDHNKVRAGRIVGHLLTKKKGVFLRGNLPFSTGQATMHKVRWHLSIGEQRVTDEQGHSELIGLRQLYVTPNGPVTEATQDLVRAVLARLEAPPEGSGAYIEAPDITQLTTGERFTWRWRVGDWAKWGVKDETAPTATAAEA